MKKIKKVERFYLVIYKKIRYNYFMKVDRKVIRIILIEILLVILLWLFINSTYIEFIPQCWVYKNTGILCPSCGGTRCIQNIMRGNVIEAFKINPVIFIIVCYLAILNIVYLSNLNKKEKKLKYIYPKYWYVIIWVTILVLYTIVRNML